MERKKWIFLIGITMMVVMLSGCVESEKIVITSENIEPNNTTAYKTEIIELPKIHWWNFEKKEMITGKIVKIE